MGNRHFSFRRPSFRKPLIRQSIRSPLDRQPSETTPSGRSLPDRPPSDRRALDRSPSERLPSDRRPSVRRPLERWPSMRRPSEWRSLETPSGRSIPDKPPSERRALDRSPSEGLPSERRPSVRRPLERLPSDRKPSERRPSVRRPLVRRPSEWRPSERSSDSCCSETCSPTHTSESYDSDADEDSEHSLSTTVKTNIQMEKNGLGFILIQNGPYIQLAGLVEKSVAARDGKLQTGDVLIKIGHDNVLGWTLRELRQRLQGTPMGTVLQIQVYRDFLPLPRRWASMMDDIPERKGADLADTFSDASEASWTSSEGTDEYEVSREETDTEGSLQASRDHPDIQEDSAATIHAHHDKTVHYKDVDEVPEATRYATTAERFLAPSPQSHWISKDWHFFERKKHTFTVGSDIGCDIMIHKDLRAECDTDVSTVCLRCSSPYWTMPKANIPSSSSSSSLSDVFWLKDSIEDAGR